MMPFLPVVRVRDVDAAIAPRVEPSTATGTRRSSIRATWTP